MRICIIGLPSSGKSTVFRALTGTSPTLPQAATGVAVRVPDLRVDTLSKLYNPKKTTYASVEYVDLGGAAGLRKDAGELGQKFLSAARQADAFVQVIDAFSLPEVALDSVIESISLVDTELATADLDQCQRRLARLKKEGGKSGQVVQETRLLEEASAWLATGQPLRLRPEIGNEETLRSFQFLSGKPIISLVNTSEDSPGWTPDGLSADLRKLREGAWGSMVSLCAKLEVEISELSPEEAKGFLADFGIAQPARERVIRESYALLGLISFFTVGEDEVRAWTLRKDTIAQEAARVIHSDIARGFIRAEVCGYATTIECGNFEAAKKQNRVRLEGKEYLVQDGDVISVRFNV